MKNLTYKKALDQIIEFFDYDKDKAFSWYMTPREELDNMSPYQAIKNGKGRKVMNFIRNGLYSHYTSNN